MDHHCPWLINCIGMKNYKFFFLLVFYTAISADIMFFTYTYKWWTMIKDDGMGHVERSFVVATVATVAYILMMILSILLTWFTGFHCLLMKRNYTTLEHFEKKKVKLRQW